MNELRMREIGPDIMENVPYALEIEFYFRETLILRNWFYRVLWYALGGSCGRNKS
jgi:hypothetical protein